MKLDLVDEKLFDCDELLLDKPINFIFGKNGTGKSTITRLVKEQICDKDIRVYQGINSVMTSGRLNSVILGEENIAAQKEIEKCESEIAKIIEDKQNFEEIKNSYNIEINSIDKKKQAQSNKLKNFYISSAREIKNNPIHIARTSYNQSAFREEIKYAFHLSEDERNKCKEYLRIDEKISIFINLPEVDFSLLQDNTKNIFEKKIEEERVIKRLDSESKINFAKRGLDIHDHGDVCSFCGNRISDETISELEVFFSASKIKDLEEKIVNQINEIDVAKSLIENVKIDRENFYSQYIDEVVEIEKLWDNLKREQLKFLSSLSDRMTEKKSKLFSELIFNDIPIPNTGKTLIEKYNVVVEQNNLEDISRLKNFSKELLRFDLIYTFIENFDLNSEKHKLIFIQDELDKSIQKAQENIKEILKIDDRIAQIQERISKEVEKTKSEKRLATNINKKLELYVDFQLEHFDIKDEAHQGYYRIKNLFDNGERYRDIETLSEGEKNIIGFLYFLEKLEEQTDNQLEKVIIFDDPMDSNDDMMQYIIITEIQELMKPIDKNRTNDILIIMTHNSHFYINVKYNRLYKDGKDLNNHDCLGDKFIRLQKKDSITSIKILESEGQDFTTSYELLWKELGFLYNNDKPNLMLNSIRRIIETFTKFNRIDNFYQNNREAQKLFNVNSHSIDDLESELNGKSKDQIISMMRKCFKDSNLEKHFNSHWKAARK
ncbi:hypothetical protein AT575_00285 [Streptococcus penaeicida]|uniref:Protein CR006 P-loop domain-containing protein n=1 Tax=Streptococcus penaeicida TaxID=1765960 RepID=A0A2N8LEJ0_9STRE|nr:AAA family ATPase [Streptococcus penaeicida]PND48587.1 hypothetical protein AT575_00285 [Streptococcus penaeicida]